MEKVPLYETMNVWERIAYKSRHENFNLDAEERDFLIDALLDSLAVAISNAPDEALMYKAKEIGLII